MNIPINDWHDWWRVGILLACIFSNYLLALRFRHKREVWNAKTKDYWFAITTWTLVGAVIAIRGIYRDYGLGAELVYTSFAVVVTITGLLRRESWISLPDNTERPR